MIDCVGTKPKQIQEFAGRVNSKHESVSVARMISPSGWEEPGQRPEFEEITVVLKGTLRVEHEGGTLDVRAGQGVVTSPGEWVPGGYRCKSRWRQGDRHRVDHSACHRTPVKSTL